MHGNPVRLNDPSGQYSFEQTPLDKLFAPAHQGINEARRYETVGVSQSEADQLFLGELHSPIANSDPSPHNFGDYRGIRNIPDNWYDKKQWHAAMDMEDHAGIATYPIAPGVVVFTGTTGMGNTVIIEHNIYGVKYYSVYGHFGENKLLNDNNFWDNGIRIRVGQNVGYSTIIGLTGNSKPGCSDCQNHLHFEVRYPSNINLSNSSDPLQGMRYWAFEGENWRDYFYDLGKLWGYDSDNFGGW